MLLKWIFDLFRVLNSNKNEGEIAAGFSFGIMLALIPGGNLLWVGLFVIGFFTRLNLLTAFVTMGLGKLLAVLIDPFLDSAGFYILNIKALGGIFTWLYNLPIVPYTAFNNSVVMGGFVVSIILAVPLFILFKKVIVLYREKVRDRIKNSRFGKYVLKLPVVGKLSGLVSRYNTLTGRG